jgi:hypothetical protein
MLQQQTINNHLLGSINKIKKLSIVSNNILFIKYTVYYNQMNSQEQQSMKENLEKQLQSEQELMEQYIKTFSKKELQSYEIAKNHLGTSFQLEKSNGFLKWKKQQET